MSNDNPYASPVTDGRPLISTEEAPAVDGLLIAGKWKRFVNLVVDQIAAFCLCMPVFFLAGFYAESTNNAALLQALDGLPGQLLSYFVFFMYYVAMEATFGRTLGKLVTRTFVVDEEGGSPRLGQILGRSLARFIPFEPFSAFSLPKGAPWHDKLSGTRVVYVGRADD